MIPNTKTIEITLSDGIHAVALARKKIKRLNLRVSSRGEISLSVPLLVGERAALKFLEDRRDWLERALARQRELARVSPQADELKAGGRLRVFGRFVPIEVFEARKPSVEYTSQALRVGLPVNNDEALAAAIEKWRRRAAKNYLEALTAELLPRFAEYGVASPSITIKKMKTRWGSCSTKKAHVNYNIRLLAVPPTCARYVVAHELAHFVEPSHGKRFYAVLGSVMPDYKERERLLKLESCEL